jgi:hypothetical protein
MATVTEASFRLANKKANLPGRCNDFTPRENRDAAPVKLSDLFGRTLPAWLCRDPHMRPYRGISFSAEVECKGPTMIER